MSAPDNEAVAGRAATTHSCPQYGDRDTISNGVSDSLDVNPFVGEGGAYDSVRPAYPDEAVAALIDAARRGRGVNAPGQGSPLRAADIGAGTGKMSELLARGGLLVDAVEPSEAMRAQASSVEGVRWHDGVGEDTGLPNGLYDIVVFAQSWHWMDSERAGLEAARVLAPGGMLAIVWNQMAVSISWVHRLTRIMRSGDVHRPDRPPTPGGGFAPMTLTQVAWEDRMTPEEILTLGTTRSSYIRSSEAGRARMQENLRWYLYEHLGYAPGEQVAIPYATLVWLTHL
ncbi:class I SAM-dependent methyltransferase [Schaalia odontolytica]|uniref:Methyltransferase domain n=1 Tax=Schaalia odontolytica TaxID=1660 RepID=A0A2X0VNK7_9ACTO|nr:class I SAM-dependent methyltransferase [Schaalia odontolytica]WMS26521.1 class I SAM-dependent methyltransferase [Schaalia odontolytica]SPT55301.1 Methyltransferase domain [Schaalia odontolytica]